MNIDVFYHLGQIRPIALALPGVKEGTCYGTPAFYVGKKLFARLREEGDILVLYTFVRDIWMKKEPQTFYITDHYKNHPYMLVALNNVAKKDLMELITQAWKSRAAKKLLKEWGGE